VSNFTHPLLDNQVYFVTTTTRNRSRVFAVEENAWLLLNILGEIRETESAKIYAFVVMPDHLHLIIKPEKESLPKVMRKIKGKSARLINQRESRKGELWQKEYFERAVRTLNDLREKYHYIIYNPVKEGLVQMPEEYPYSSEKLKEMIDEPEG